MTTAQDVFDAAIVLIDGIDENTGSANTADTKEYKNKTLAILNVLRGELYPYSDTYTVEEDSKRPIAALIKDFTSPIGLDDYICQTIMPYGLASHLLLTEDTSSASFFQQRYEELKHQLAVGLPQVSEDIYDVYGGLEPYNEFGMWS